MLREPEDRNLDDGREALRGLAAALPPSLALAGAVVLALAAFG
ncbi:MAG TPA: hypothetical protein VFY87_30305 [Geminicoccaceae bacterium]|jgi:hypothetical protein|nr:hypothetical protein [Geminicoccaceae bacterium]